MYIQVKECPICMSGLPRAPDKTQIYLLSCTHVFHVHCLESFERFDAIKAEQAQGPVSECRCPICRAAYQKIKWVMPVATVL
jgi:hypothetical protein